MKIEYKKTIDIKFNPNNPRVIKDEKFNKLVRSIAEFPQMLEIRPIVIDENNIVLGGNMRLKACQELKLKEIPIMYAKELTEEQKKEFIIKDNVGFGEWDWSVLANEWDTEQLEAWGLDVWHPNSGINLDDFFKEDNEIKENKNKIVLEYTNEDFELVNDAFSKLSGSKEQIVFKLLGL